MSTDSYALGGLIRAWRQRLLPSDIGLPSYGRRRTKGLQTVHHPVVGDRGGCAGLTFELVQG